MATLRSVSRITELYNDHQHHDKGYLSPSSFSISKQAKAKLDELFPKLNVQQINLDMSQTIYQALLKYPAYRDTKYKELSLEQCYLHPEYMPIKLKTVKATFSYLKRAIRWARFNNHIKSDDVIHYLVLPKKEKESVSQSRGQLILPTSKSERIQKNNKAVLPWSNELLKKVFETHIFKTPKKVLKTGRPKKYIPLHFWLFPMAYYHGFRAREIAQLSLDDVMEIDGYLGVTINDSKPYQRVKNVSSRRFVPLHEDFLKLGFDEYLRWRKALKTNSDLLFLTPVNKAFLSQDGAHNRISQQIRREAGLPPRSGYNTHSFRHLFIDELRSKHIPKWKIASVVGHDSSDHSSITDEYGSHSVSLNELHHIVNSFTAPIDLVCKWSDFKNYYINVVI